MIFSCDLMKIESFDFDSKISKSKSMILSEDFRKNESFDFDSKILKLESNDFVGRFSKKRII